MQSELLEALVEHERAMDGLRAAFCAVTMNSGQVDAYNAATAATRKARAAITKATEIERG